MLTVAVAWRHHSRAINQVYTFHQGDILPNLGLSRNWCHGTYPLLAKGVDDRRLSSVGIANEANGNLLSRRMKGRELAQKSDERSFTKRVGERGMES